jgi:hypothetical protein
MLLFDENFKMLLPFRQLTIRIWRKAWVLAQKDGEVYQIANERP